jgi:hypothetical protein
MLVTKELQGVSVAIREEYECMIRKYNNILDVAHACLYIGTQASVTLMDLKNGTTVVELPNRVFSALELVCYLFPRACVLPILGHVRKCTYIQRSGGANG